MLAQEMSYKFVGRVMLHIYAYMFQSATFILLCPLCLELMLFRLAMVFCHPLEKYLR